MSLFQSTHPRGVRHDGQNINGRAQEFQSTHPRGVRRYQSLIHATTVHKFQSTHPRGVRLGAIFQGWSDPIFQSTHPRGVRHGPAAQCLRRRISIHAPTWGATLLEFSRGQSRDISIHAPTWGATGYRQDNPA